MSDFFYMHKPFCNVSIAQSNSTCTVSPPVLPSIWFVDVSLQMCSDYMQWLCQPWVASPLCPRNSWFLCWLVYLLEEYMGQHIRKLFNEFHKKKTPKIHLLRFVWEAEKNISGEIPAYCSLEHLQKLLTYCRFGRAVSSVNVHKSFVPVVLKAAIW